MLCTSSKNNGNQGCNQKHDKVSCLSVHTPVVVVKLCLEFTNDRATHAANILKFS